MLNESEKVTWSGKIVSVQPRTSVWRYKLDNRTHYYNGYNLFLDGEVNGLRGPFSVAISEKQQKKFDFFIGDEIRGSAWTKKRPAAEYAGYYRAGSFRVINKAERGEVSPPPFSISPVPDMEVYQWRGARMLSSSCYKGKCFQCVWAAMAAVAIEYDWGKQQKYRYESFCYGPKSCRFYKKGRPRAVPYKGEGSYYDEGWMDDILSENEALTTDLSA